MANALMIKDLVKSYDEKFTLGQINLKVPKGQIIGLIGENGAGKTTLIKAIIGAIKIDSGTIEIFGSNNDDELVKENIGIVLDNSFFPEIMSPNDINIVMKDVYKNWDSNLFVKYIHDFNIPLNKQLKNLSKGMRKKVEIATALSHKPKLLILDEATSGLDPVVRNEILDIFLEFIQDEEHSILLSTHITSDLERIADRIVFINNGKIIFDDLKDELLDNYGILRCELERFSEVLETDIVAYKKNKYNYEILIKNKSKISKKYRDFIIDKVTLEELMVLMIKGVKK